MYREKGEEDSLQRLFIGITHQYFLNIHMETKELGIHPGQIPMLHLLECEGGLTQREIARRLNIQPPTVTVTIRRLEKAGLVSRSDDDKDRRVSRISLTKEGRAMSEKIGAIVKKQETQMFRGFSESEQCLLRRFFKEMRDNLTENRDEKKEKTHD